MQQNVFDLSATPAVTPAYTLATTWNTETKQDPETHLDKNTYTETVTVNPATNASIVTAPEAVTVNIDGKLKIIKSFRSVRTALLQTTERQQSNMYLKICCVVVLSE